MHHLYSRFCYFGIIKHIASGFNIIMMMKIVATLMSLVLICNVILAQPDRWQQFIKYDIAVQLLDKTNTMDGTENIEYSNNSPDTLHKLFFHLYWNAFRPNSAMDIRSLELGKNLMRRRNGDEILDWDSRVKDRISKLKEDEMGYNHVTKLTINGIAQELIEHETILEVRLTKDILPKSKTTINLTFKAQVPIQIRRSGRNSAEGIQFSISQWYPKMVEYDYQGWNANPYIAREFYGVWGEYDVKITVDKKYMVAATGILKNANTIGYGYETPGTILPIIKGNNITWNFVGQNIHDFVWAADTAYVHISKKIREGLTLNAFYKKGNGTNDSAWKNVLWAAEKVLPFMEKNYGQYPYPQYSFIQGGDGGMEYAMATLIKNSSLGTVFHEWLHSWYQQMLGTNESLFPWMDEGFTEYSTDQVSNYYYTNWAISSPFVKNNQAAIEDATAVYKRLPLIEAANYDGYFSLAKSGMEEPLSTHADHFNTNWAYNAASYSKGAVFLNQLGYIVSDSIRNKILLEYYHQWRFKHPNANDFIRVAEKISNLNLQWYKEYWMNSTKTIDYALGNMSIDSLTGKTQITLKRIGKMPMPIDVVITLKDGSKEYHTIPLDLMFGAKPAENGNNVIVDKEWQWTHPEYTLETSLNLTDIKSLEIDPSQRMADVNRVNNKLVIPD